MKKELDRVTHKMKLEIFIDSFERTHYGDAIYSSIGRALTISTRFENNCKMLAVILELKENPSFDDEENFNAFVKKLYKKRLFDDIQKVLKISKGYNDILNIARKSRNEHLKNIFKTDELDENSVIRNFRITAADGKNYK